MDTAVDQPGHVFQPYSAPGHDLYRRGMVPSQLNQMRQHRQPGGTVRASAAGEDPVGAGPFQTGQCISRVQARSEGSIECPVEGHLCSGVAAAGHPGKALKCRNVRAAVGRQHSYDDARGTGVQHRRHIALKYVKLLSRVHEAAGPRPDKHMDRKAHQARLRHGADAWRNAVRFRECGAELNPRGAHRRCEPNPRGVFHRQLK